MNSLIRLCVNSLIFDAPRTNTFTRLYVHGIHWFTTICYPMGILFVIANIRKKSMSARFSSIRFLLSLCLIVGGAFHPFKKYRRPIATLCYCLRDYVRKKCYFSKNNHVKSVIILS